ncbi:MAG: DUF459 domain-containing protein [Alphaproteobacteria bacterium]
MDPHKWPAPSEATQHRKPASRRRLLSWAGGAVVAAAAGVGLVAAPPSRAAGVLLADGSDFSAPADTEWRPIRIGVFGDSLADGIWAGLYRTLQRNERFEVARHTEVSSGLARPDFFDWEAELGDVLASETIDVAVVCFGLNDNQPVYYEGRRQFSFASDEWNQVYTQRVAAFIDRLQQSGVPVFWVGLPTVRDDDFGAQMAHLNDIYATEALLADATFVPTLAITADADGAYSAYLPDESGRNRLVRANDGVHFTGRGYEMIAKELLAAMQRELTYIVVDDSANG